MKVEKEKTSGQKLVRNLIVVMFLQSKFLVSSSIKRVLNAFSNLGNGLCEFDFNYRFGHWEVTGHVTNKNQIYIFFFFLFIIYITKLFFINLKF